MSDDIETHEEKKPLLSETMKDYKLTDQQEECVQYYLFDPACRGDVTASYHKAGYDKNRPEYLKPSNANSFFRRKRIINRVKELTHDESITTLDVFDIDKLSATKDLKEALALFKKKVTVGEYKSHDANAYVRLVDMQNKASGLYTVVEETINTEDDKKIDSASNMFLQEIEKRKQEDTLKQAE